MKTSLIFSAIFLLVAMTVAGQEEKKSTRFEFYGMLITDIGYNFNQIDSAWYDVLRPSKLPSHKNQYAPDGKVYFSVRQTSLGMRSLTSTPWGDLKAKIAFDLFGTGVNTGQTAIHLRQVYFELGKFAVGQVESPFMDPDASPDILEYWAPPGRVFLRNILIRYMPVQGDSRISFALEKPGASADEGIYADRIELKNVKSKLNLPDLTAQCRMGRSWGYLQLGGLIKWIKWVDTGFGPYDLGGHAVGWGLNFSTNLHFSDADLLRAQLVYGKGIENYLTDAPFDIGIKNNFGNPRTPILGVPLPVLGFLAFLEHHWNKQWSSTIGYSAVYISNSDGQTDNSFKSGQYAILNLLYLPFTQFRVGAELQWGRRDNFRDGFSSSIVKFQLSFRYSFSHIFYSNKE